MSRTKIEEFKIEVAGGSDRVVKSALEDSYLKFRTILLEQPDTARTLLRMLDPCWVLAEARTADAIGESGDESKLANVLWNFRNISSIKECFLRFLLLPMVLSFNCKFGKSFRKFHMEKP